MPENFEEQLEQAAGLATTRARLGSVDAVRARGDQRRRRRLTADAALGVAAVAVAVVLGTMLTGGSSNSHLPVTGSPSASVSSPAASPSTGATSTPSPSQSSAPTTGAGSPATSQGTGAAPDPGKYVAGAWLTAHQEPFGAQITWQPATNPVGSHIGSAVFKVADTNTATGLAAGTGCALTAFGTSLAGAQYQMFNGPNNGANLSSTAIAASAAQGIYFYPNSATATAAWNSLSVDYGYCAQTETGTNAATGVQQFGYVEQVIDQADAQCWSNLQTQTASATSSGTVVNGCYVLHGDLIEWVNVRVNNSTLSGVDFSSADHTTLTTMRQSLTAYAH
jgi:hypothetical protein